MAAVNIYEAKTQLSRLVARKPTLRFGLLKGKIRVAADFDAPLPDSELAEFEGR